MAYEGLLLSCVAPALQVMGATEDHGLKYERRSRGPAMIQPEPDRRHLDRLPPHDEYVLLADLVLLVAQEPRPLPQADRLALFVEVEIAPYAAPVVFGRPGGAGVIGQGP